MTSQCASPDSQTTLQFWGEITEAEIVKKMLHVAPETLEQVAISIETLLDLDNLSVEEVTGHLRNVEQRKKTAASNRQGRLLLTEEEWRARTRSRNNAADGGGSARGFVEVFATFHSWVLPTTSELALPSRRAVTPRSMQAVNTT